MADSEYINDEAMRHYYQKFYKFLDATFKSKQVQVQYIIVTAVKQVLPWLRAMDLIILTSLPHGIYVKLSESGDDSITTAQNPSGPPTICLFVFLSLKLIKLILLEMLGDPISSPKYVLIALLLCSVFWISPSCAGIDVSLTLNIPAGVRECLHQPLVEGVEYELEYQV